MRFEKGLPVFLKSRAVLVVVMGSLSGGANKLSTGSDLTESLSCPGTQPTYLPTSSSPGHTRAYRPGLQKETWPPKTFAAIYMHRS